MRYTIQLSIFTACFLAITIISPALASTVQNQVRQPIQQAIKTRQDTQQEIDKWQKDKERLAARFETLESQTDQLTEYLKKLEARVGASRKRVEQKQQQIDETRKITDEITPFLDELLANLQTVSLDGPPFLITERKTRLEKMEEMMTDTTVSIGEKYRRLMEALQIEAEYGFTTENYQQTIDTGEGTSLVEVLRLGRLNLFYLQLDGRGCGYYDEAEKNWKPLDSKWLRGISEAMAIAKKERPASLVVLPLGKIQN